MLSRLLAITAAAIALLASSPMMARAETAASLGDGVITGAIDAPTNGSVLGAGQPFSVNGWLVDKSSAFNVGIDAIGITAQQSGGPAIDLGQARLALSRPDVANALNNPNWNGAGYSLDVTSGLPSGTYTIAISAHTTSQGWVSRTATLTVGDLSAQRWTTYGFNVDAPTSMWPMLELLHHYNFDWALSAAGRRATPIRWDDQLPSGTFAQYAPKQNIVKLSTVLQTTSLEARATLLAHELTHLHDDLDGLLGDMSTDNCYGAETRAFVNEGNLWSMLFGKAGKQNPDAIEDQENTKMWAFAGNSRFADLVVRTTASYVRQCGE